MTKIFIFIQIEAKDIISRTIDVNTHFRLLTAPFFLIAGMTTRFDFNQRVSSFLDRGQCRSGTAVSEIIGFYRHFFLNCRFFYLDNSFSNMLSCRLKQTIHFNKPKHSIHSPKTWPLKRLLYAPQRRIDS